ncbi:MAG: ATP-binding protein [Alphaproteobacteria bacterium]|nr:ATP-binding protein [Alphaproteobacteria bacterium]
MTVSDTDSEFLRHLSRIADALEKYSPTDPTVADMEPAGAYVWNHASRRLAAVARVNRVDLRLLCGVDHQRDSLLSNTIAFVRGFAANNALLWGARGTGKSSLVKAVHGTVTERGMDCALVEVHREDISDLPFLMHYLSQIDRRFIVFTDDLTFDHGDSSYKSLKAALDGGVEGRPDNVIFYATSNRRHLMPRQMIENERSTAINPSESVEESVSLSDRFGLWIGFHSIDQDTYFAIVEGYVAHFGMNTSNVDVRREALAWSMERGSRSGRVAWQFIVDLAARTETDLTGKR